MVTCSACGRTIEKIPTWLTDVQVDFVCHNCPKRADIKNITQVHLEALVAPVEPQPVPAEVVEAEEAEAEREPET
jgi:DNA-directed RNA polymerase subunit RPC12/RpoP